MQARLQIYLSLALCAINQQDNVNAVQAVNNVGWKKALLSKISKQEWENIEDSRKSDDVAAPTPQIAQTACDSSIAHTPIPNIDNSGHNLEQELFSQSQLNQRTTECSRNSTTVSTIDSMSEEDDSDDFYEPTTSKRAASQRNKFIPKRLKADENADSNFSVAEVASSTASTKRKYARAYDVGCRRFHALHQKEIRKTATLHKVNDKIYLEYKSSYRTRQNNLKALVDGELETVTIDCTFSCAKLSELTKEEREKYARYPHILECISKGEFSDRFVNYMGRSKIGWMLYLLNREKLANKTALLEAIDAFRAARGRAPKAMDGVLLKMPKKGALFLKFPNLGQRIKFNAFVDCIFDYDIPDSFRDEYRKKTAGLDLTDNQRELGLKLMFINRNNQELLEVIEKEGLQKIIELMSNKLTAR